MYVHTHTYFSSCVASFICFSIWSATVILLSLTQPISYPKTKIARLIKDQKRYYICTSPLHRP